MSSPEKKTRASQSMRIDYEIRLSKENNGTIISKFMYSMYLLLHTFNIMFLMVCSYSFLFTIFLVLLCLHVVSSYMRNTHLTPVVVLKLKLPTFRLPFDLNLYNACNVTLIILQVSSNALVVTLYY